MSNTYSLISKVYGVIYMVTIIVVIINHNIWIKISDIIKCIYYSKNMMYVLINKGDLQE